MIALDLVAFRAAFPQFASAITFPDALIQLQYGMATGYVSADTYGDLTAEVRTSALYLMTAHLLALGVLIAAGGYTGRPGILTSASIGDVNVSLQPPPQRTQWDYWLNLTPYGGQLVALLDAQSVGGFYVGGLPERAAFRKIGGIF